MSILQEIHHQARNWGDRTAPKLRNSVAANGLIDTGALQQSIVSRTWADERVQEIRVSFRFLRYGIFAAKGARRGHAGKKGTTWRDASGKLRRTNTASLNKLQNKHDWYNPIVRKEIIQLKEELGQVMIIEAKKIFI